MPGRKGLFVIILLIIFAIPSAAAAGRGVVDSEPGFFPSAEDTQTYIDGANIGSETAAGYTLMNCRILYRWHIAGISGDLVFQGRNLTGEKFVAFTEPDAGGNAYQPGPGHELFGEVKVNLGE